MSKSNLIVNEKIKRSNKKSRPVNLKKSKVALSGERGQPFKLRSNKKRSSNSRIDYIVDTDRISTPEHRSDNEILDEGNFSYSSLINDDNVSIDFFDNKIVINIGDEQ